ncbi:MAG: tRNA (adenosine(37)-N6)-threonylcarbamoyltransferase complex dimerization subunit type 1 TsaB [Pyramidobacter sp.]|nr:tRNA (adenosine(37)-N6)-threonylcarbamoyltransferase complex dimerization subunit type 1 TsaB [Pyramidobacter sp.]
MSDVLLSIDCSNRWSCLGLAVGGKIAGERNLDLGREQAARLPLLAAELLAGHGLKIQDVACVAVTVGPGYFTGIRIGMAYAAGLAFALGVRIVPLSSLEAVLRSCPGWDCGVKAPLIAASRELAFSSVYRDGCLVLAEKERTYEELLSKLREISRDFEMWSVKDARLFASSPREGVQYIANPSGAAHAALALERLHASIKPDELRARYLREPGLGRSL